MHTQGSLGQVHTGSTHIVVDNQIMWSIIYTQQDSVHTFPLLAVRLSHVSTAIVVYRSHIHTFVVCTAKHASTFIRRLV